MKRIALGVGAVAAGLSMAVFGTGVAAAGDDYAGMTYGDASSAAGEAGLTPIIATRNGGLPDDECTVDRSQTSSFFDESWTNPGGQVMFYLNCTAPVAEPGVSGNSAASPAGRAELSQRAQEAAEQAAQEQAALEQSRAAELEGQ